MLPRRCYRRAADPAVRAHAFRFRFFALTSFRFAFFSRFAAFRRSDLPSARLTFLRAFPTAILARFTRFFAFAQASPLPPPPGAVGVGSTASPNEIGNPLPPMKVSSSPVPSRLARATPGEDPPPGVVA